MPLSAEVNMASSGTTPSLKDFREELGHKLTEATKDLKEKIGLSLSDLVELPQGTLTVAAITKDSAREEVAASSLPVDIVIMADAGENEKKMLEVARTRHQAGRGSQAPKSRPSRSTGSRCTSSSFRRASSRKPMPKKKRPSPSPTRR